MNRIYKVIWSKARNCYVVVSEIAKTHSKGGTGVSGVVKKVGSSALLTAAVTAMLMTPVGSAWADPIPTQEYDPVHENIVIGEDVSASSTENVVVGVHSHAGEKGAVAVGVAADANTENSIAIGNDVEANGDAATAIGHEAHTQGDETTAVGNSAKAEMDEASAYGNIAKALGEASTAIGHDSTAKNGSDTALGDRSTAEGGGSSAIGPSSHASGSGSSAMGSNSVATGTEASALGSKSTANGDGSTAAGKESVADGKESTALGKGATATKSKSTATGADATASGTNSTALGTGATASNASSTAVGDSASASGLDSTALGSGSIADAKRAVALGGGESTTDEVTGETSNNAAEAKGEDSIAIGSGARTTKEADSAVAIGGGGDGKGAVASGKDSVALGTGTTAAGASSVAIGGGEEKDGATALGEASIVLGNNAGSAEGATNGVAIGTGSSVTVENGVALGAGSIASTGKDIEGYVPNPNRVPDTTISTWTSTEAAVSIGATDESGNPTMTRQITGVAAGTNDWDAANVAQLKAAMTHYYSVDTTKATDEAGNNNYDNDGAQSSGKNAIAAGVNAKATAANASAFGSNVTASGINATAIGTAGTTAGDFSTAIGNGSVSASSASTAVGYGNVSASGTSQAFGNNNVSASNNSTAIGYGGVSATGRGRGQGSLAMGSNGVTASNGSIAIGISGVTASGLNSTAIGINSVTASGSNSTAIGGNGIATGSENSVVVGYSNSTIDSSSEGAYAFGKSVTITSSSGGLALGNSTSLSSASGSTAVGSQTSVSGSNGSAAMGTSSKVTGSSAGSTAVGNGVTVERSSSGSAAFGTSTTITSSNGSTLVGNNSRITGSYGVSVLGVNTTISDSNGAIAMGNYASISKSSGAILLAENNSSISDSSGSTAIGNSVSISKGSGSNVFGDSSSINSDGGSMVLGNSSNITSGSGSHLLGNQSSVNSSAGSTVIGNSSSVAGGSNGSHVFGNSASVKEGSEGSVAIGNASTVYGNSDGSYAIGGNAKVYGGSNGATAVGPNSEVSNGSGGSQAFGNAAKVTNGSGGASAVGSGALVDGSGGSDAFGNNAKVIGGGGSTAVGNAAQVTGSGGATAVGTNAYVGGSDNGLAVGARSSVTGGWAGTAIGTDASTTVSQGVALGSNALAERGPEEEDGYDPIGEHPGQEGTPTWRATAAAVSVGGKTFAKQNENGEYVDADGNVVETAAEAEQITYTRQITNVAAGRLDTDAVNVAQLKQLAGQMAEEGSLSFGSDGYVPATETEPAKEQITKWHGQTLQIIGDTTYKTDETTSEPVVDKDGNIITSVDKAKDGTDAIKISLARDIDVDTVVVNGKDGAPGEPGTPGSIGMKGEDGEIKTVTITSEGKPGVDGKDGETITRLIVDDKPVATLDDGLKFGANAPEEEEGDNPVANKLNSTVKIVGVDAKEDHEYSADNLTTTVKQAEDGTTTITVMMDKDPEFDTLVVNGKDGAPGEPGTPGSIGMKGEDGEIKTVTITSEGKPGVDGKDGETITRLIVDDKPVATLDDGLRFAGDDGLNADGSETDKVIPKKLNNRLDIVGDTQYEITTTTTDTTTSTNAKKIKDGNILTSKGTAQDGSDAIKIELNKDVDLGPDGSLMVGGEVDEEGNPKTDEYGNPTSIKIGPQTVYNINGGPETGDYIIGLDNKTWDPTNIVSGRAATEDQLAAVQTHYYSVNDNGTQQDNWDNKGATGVNALAAGTNAKATGDRSVAVGDKARVTTDGGVAIGADSVATTGPSTGGYDVITGARNFVDTANAHAWTSSAAAVSVGNMDGNEPITRQITGVAAGTLDTDAVNVAQLRRVANAASIHDYSVNSVDPTHDQNYNNSGAVGSNALAAGVNARALGDNAVAVGNATNAQKKDAVAIGNGADAFYENSVALGANTQTAKEVGTASYEIAGTTYYFAGAKPVGTVSVGTEGVEGDKRTITNVAAGRISEESTDAINGSQLWAVTEAMKSGHTEVTVGEGTPAGEGEGVYNTGGNLDLNVTQAEDGHNIYDLKLAKDIDVDTIVVNGKDGAPGEPGLTIKGADGAPGAIGIDGADGETKIITLTGKDGEPGKPGLNGENITRLIVDEHEVATMDDGLKFGANRPEANSGNPVANKLNSTIHIKAEDPVEGHTYSTKNLTTTVDQDDEGNTTILVKMDNDLTADTIVLNGKDGINGMPGEPGKMGIKGTDGEVRVVTIKEDGTPGLDGKDGETTTRLVFDEQEVATMDDGLKYAGDFGDGAAVKLNNTVNVKGEAVNEDDLTTGNIGVVANQNANGKDADLIIKLNKDIKLGETGSITMGDVHIHDGDEISFGGNVIHNVAPGVEDTDVVNVSQLKEYSSGARTEVTVNEGTAAPTDGTYTDDGGNLQLRLTQAADGHDIYDVKLSDDITIGGPGKDGKDGVDGHIGVDGKDGKSGVGIDGKDGITVYGKDGKDGEPAVAINGKDGVGHIGLAGPAGKDGKDGVSDIHMIWGEPIVGKDGAPGTDGITRIEYTDPEGNPHQVATTDDGLYFGANTGDPNPAPNRINSRVNIMGAGTKDDDSYSGENLKTIISQEGEGKDAVTTINVVMDRDLNVDNIAINGKDGKDGAPGTAGHIGVDGKDGKAGVGIDGKDGITVTGKDGKDGVTIYGKDGENGTEGHIGLTGQPGKDGKDAKADITVKEGPVGVDGTDGADGKDGMDRIVYEDHNGTEHEVATLDDGMKYSGDFGNTKENPVPVKLNNNVDIVGNSTAASEDELSDGNIGVVAKATEDGGAQLVVKLNKNIDLTEEGSVTMGDTVINNEGLTINNGGPEGDIVINKGDVSFGGNVIHNVAPGVELTDVVNVSQLKEVEQLASQHSTVTVDGSPIDENVTDGNLLLTVTKEEGKGTNYDLKLNDNIELGGPGKDGKDGVDGSIGVNGADGKSGVGIDGKDGISVRGTDGKDGVTIYAKNGEDGKDGSEGHIGLAGKNGKDGADGVTDIYTKWGDGTPGTYGKDGKDGTDGITRIVYTDPEGDEHQVATMDDGLKFGANSGDPNPAVNKLSSTVEIKGAGEKDDDNYTGKNLKTIISQEGEGKDAVTTINVVMDKDLETETLVVNGKDGKDGEPGQAGHIGIDGKDGEAGIGIDGKDGITITGKDGKDGVSIRGVDGKDGTEGHIGLAGRDGKDADIFVGKGDPGVDGKDGITRIIYQDPSGEEPEIQVATLEDGMKYGGDFGDGAAVKLNKTVNVVGEAKNEADLTTGNIGVVAVQDGDNAKLTVKLNKDIDLGSKGSVKMGDTTINNDGLTINEGPSVTKNGIDAGGKKITNVAPGVADTDAVNVSQLKDFQGDVNRNIGDVNNRINRLGDRVDKVGAGAAALAGLHPLDFDPDAKWDVAAGYGHYRGENAVAVGAFYRPSEDVMVNVASTVGNGDNMISAGVSVKVGGNTHVSNSRVALSKQVLEMRKEIEDMRSLMADSAFGKQLDLSKLQLFPDTPENHWAYDYVATLAGNGLLEGYPDGNFRGDRALTRYEVAAILYRAMLNGAQLTQRALEEFAPELDRIRVDTLTRHSDGTPSIQRVRIIKDRR